MPTRTKHGESFHKDAKTVRSAKFWNHGDTAARVIHGESFATITEGTRAAKSSIKANYFIETRNKVLSFGL